MRRTPFVLRLIVLGLLGLRGGSIPRTNGGPCDTAGIYPKEYSTPTAPRDQWSACSRRTMTYVFTAPDFNKSAGSIGESAGVGFSRMLEGMSKFMMNWGWIDGPFRTRVTLRGTLQVRFFVANVAVVSIFTSRKRYLPCSEF